MNETASLFDLSGKVALVTGGSRGLGREIAAAYSAAGARVVIASRNGVHCAEYASELEAKTGVEAMGLALHVGHWDENERALEAVRERFGRLDVLVNNAGMSPVYDSPAGLTEALFDKVLDVNLKGPYRLAALAGTWMAEGDGGAIINISSAAALRPRADVLPYAAAKAGLNAITLGLARAFGPSVRVNAILAGTFLTDVSAHWDMEAFEQRAKGFALGRAGEPGEIVGTALYLASAASSYTTGAIVAVDGGQ
jgi:NAD(P)-dependent dehydrogenase (short-subunit alcohol dehydrogenase family)